MGNAGSCPLEKWPASANEKPDPKIVTLQLDELDSTSLQIEAQAETLLMLDRALTRLAGADARLVQVVELRFFAGLSVEEAAKVLGVSVPTVKRDTRAARAFLRRTMSDGEAG